MADPVKNQTVCSPKLPEGYYSLDSFHLDFGNLQRLAVGEGFGLHQIGFKGKEEV